MGIVIFGSSGQLAQSLRDTTPVNRRPVFIGRDACNLSDPFRLNAILEKEKPEFIINAAAYTAVDKAEEEPQQARLVNEEAVRCLAKYSRASGAQFIHLSTDFVFDGTKQSPYLPGDATGPLGVYGQSKLAGELAALEEAPESTMIIRTAWVYSEHGSNFVKTMLRLMNERDELGVVDDQRGAPTYAGGLAELIWQIHEQELFTAGIYHWTDQANITWCDFARAIQEEAIAAGLLKKAVPINAITTDDYPTPAARPAYSVLDNTKLATLMGLEPAAW
ncbi:MAG TPA: dTDP-4-dehydrorhamnose reductase, partial [Porticoccaceae bacterium]|nr:dTDP-4-dehydrorhamnose reductase [Porticoccaceae bacterium]